MTLQQPSARGLRPFRPVPFGRYTLLLPISTGGMGEIYLARLEGAQGFEKLCVIKKILPHLSSDPDFVERFTNEAKTLVKLSHGSIAQVLDMGLHEGDPYLALEHVDGKDLRKVAARMRDRNMPIPLTFVLYVMSRVLDALAYAHRKRDDEDKEIGLVHRDISPQNILISYEGEVKVIDFGLAKSTLNAAKTNPSIILGKFLYMSPEQARHQKVDRRSDLYSVGLCLYELISGKNPFEDCPPGELMARVASPNIPSLHTVEPLCPGNVEAVVMKALSPDPAGRFQTAEEFRGKLLQCLLEIDPSAGPESVSRFMRETFATEYQQERKMLGQLREQLRAVARPEPPAKKEVETAVFALRDVAPNIARRAEAGIQPQELSFAPTPRAHESQTRPDGETMPSIVIEESTHPGAPLLPQASRVELNWTPPSEGTAMTPVERRPGLDATIEEPETEAVPTATATETQPRVLLGEPMDPPIVGTLLEPQLPPPEGRLRTAPSLKVRATPPPPPGPRRGKENPFSDTEPTAAQRSRIPRVLLVLLGLVVLGVAGYVGYDMFRAWRAEKEQAAAAAVQTSPIRLELVRPGVDQKTNPEPSRAEAAVDDDQLAPLAVEGSEPSVRVGERPESAEPAASPDEPAPLEPEKKEPPASRKSAGAKRLGEREWREAAQAYEDFIQRHGPSIELRIELGRLEREYDELQRTKRIGAFRKRVADFRNLVRTQEAIKRVSP